MLNKIGNFSATKVSFKIKFLIGLSLICVITALIFFSFNITKGVNLLFPNLTNLVNSLSSLSLKSGSAIYTQNGVANTLADFSIGGSSYKVKINSTKSLISSSTIYQLGMTSVVYGLSLNSVINLKADDSLVRVVLVDKNKKEYLVYEAYPILNSKGKITITNVCEETCALPGIVPLYLKIQTNNAEITINEVNYLNSSTQLNAQAKSNLATYNLQLKTKQVDYKIAKINEQINLSGMHWLAARTSVSDLNYEQKKKLFNNASGTPANEIPNLQGFEYYKGGIFELKDSSTEIKAVASSTLPDNWDWRNVNGENWMTSVKNQGSFNTCWAFSMIGSLESLIKLNYNSSTLDIDLSEQSIINCKNNLTYYDSKIINLLGVPNESYAPYTGNIESQNCGAGINYASSSWRVKNIINSPALGSDLLRYYLIKYGPLDLNLLTWRHEMTVAGYGILKEGDNAYSNILSASYDSPIRLLQGDSLIGKTFWTVKNSWGESWGVNGYGKIIVNQSRILVSSIFLAPVSSPSIVNYKISCIDKDLDKYCSWGISEQPPTSSNCPLTCRKSAGKFIKDFDDSNPKLVSFISETNLNGRSKFDINGDMLVNSIDRQMVIDGSLGKITIAQNPYIDLDGDGKVNAIDVQLEIHGILGR